MPNASTNIALGADGPLESRLQSFVPLSRQDLTVLRGCYADARLLPPRSEVLHTTGGAPRLVVAGWIGWSRTLADGRRQILHLDLPGDVLSPGAWAGCAAMALTPVKTTDASPLLRALEPGVAPEGLLQAAWAASQAELRRGLLDHLTRLGTLTAYERTAHLLLDLVKRQKRAGLSDGRRMAWPITQEVLADVLGLSIVHVNRILQQLRRQNIIELRSSLLQIRDPAALAAGGAARRPSAWRAWAEPGSRRGASRQAEPRMVRARSASAMT